MPNLRDIKRRIASIQKTQQITRAMRMVAAAKLRRAQEAIAAARPYADRMRSTLMEVAASSPDAENPLLQSRDSVKSLEVVVITSDRGLAGAFNSNVSKEADQLLREREVDEIHLTLLGRKAADYYRRRRGGQIAHEERVGTSVEYAAAAGIAQRLASRFVAGEVDEVVLVYNEFVSTLTQRPKRVGLLPIAVPENQSEDAPLPYSIEPSAEQLLAILVPKAIEVEIFRALLENQAGEHAARMTAMENATRNTEELVDTLTLDYNRARQAAITKELVEIVTGAQALE